MTGRVVRANVQLLPTEEGGRSTPLGSSRYRSTAHFAGTDVGFGFQLELEESEQLAPGESATARLTFWAVEDLPDLSVGDEFQVREGTRIVGRAVILDPDIDGDR